MLEEVTVPRLVVAGHRPQVADHRRRAAERQLRALPQPFGKVGLQRMLDPVQVLDALERERRHGQHQVNPLAQEGISKGTILGDVLVHQILETSCHWYLLASIHHDYRVRLL